MSTQSNQLRLDLTRKAVLLFAAIFIVEALYVGIIASMLWQTSNSIKRTQESRVVVQAVGEVAYGAQEIVGELLEGFFNDVLHQPHRPIKISAEKRLRMMADNLEEALKNDDSQKAIVRDIKEMCTNSVPPLVRDLREANWGDPTDTRRFSMIRLDEVNADLMHRLDDITSVYGKAKADAAAELTSHTSFSATTAIVLGFVVNAVIALLLYFAFINGITRRLSKIAEDISLVASKKQLPAAAANLTDSADEIDMLAYEIRKMSENFSEIQSKERTLFENVPSIMCAINDDGVIMSVSPGSSVLWGYDADELLGKRMSEIFHDTALAEVAQKLEALFEDDVNEIDFQAAVSTKKQERLQVAWKARLSEDVTALVIGHDVTEEVEALDRIKNSEEEFRAIVDKMPISVVTLDENYSITSVNEATQEMFNTPPQTLLGRNIGALIAGATTSGASGAQVLDLLSSSEKNPVSLNVGYDKDSVLPVEMNTSTYVNAYARKTYLVTFQDISVRTEIERVKQDFVAMISHDLRSPLTALFGTLETLVETTDAHDDDRNPDSADSDSSSTSEPDKPLIRAKSIVSDLVNLINDFLDLEKFEAGRGVLDQRKQPLRDILKETVAVMPKRAGERITTSASIESPVQIKIDHDRMLFALTNFLSTVLQYSSETSKVNVSVFKDQNSISVSFSCPEFALPESVRNSCLSRYEFQPAAKNSILDSSGLALALSRAIVLAHSGSVTFSDDPGTQAIIIQIPTA